MKHSSYLPKMALKDMPRRLYLCPMLTIAPLSIIVHGSGKSKRDSNASYTKV
jgi:hypothetical protein